MHADGNHLHCFLLYRSVLTWLFELKNIYVLKARTHNVYD